LLLPLLGGALQTKALLHEWMLVAGLTAVLELFGAEAAAVAGPKGRKQRDRKANHWGATPTELVLGGRKVTIPRPRLRSVGGGEVELPSVRRFRLTDPLSQRMVNQMLLGVSTRRYERSLEPVPPSLKSRGTSKSAVSRAFVATTRRNVEEQLCRPLGELSLIGLMVDGLCVDGKSVVAALGIGRQGEKHVLGLRLGSTENAVLCTELLQDLLGRGLKVSGPILCVIDGGAGLRRALRDVLGDLAVIQRCQVHKMRNVEGHLPKKAQTWVLSQMREAYRAPGADAARRQLQRLAAWLERNGHEDAAGSLREGLEETLTVLKLRLPRTLTRSLSTTNAIENLMGAIRRVSRRVARWRSGSMIRRWVGLAIFDAQRRFRRVKGHREIPLLIEALGRLQQSRIASREDAA
jgi:transposase-like protein